MYDELVKRLRERSVFLFPHHGESRSYDADLMHEAADAIEELMRRCEQFQYMPPPAWIPVTERLPEEHVNVLAWLRSLDGKSFYYSIDHLMEDGQWWKASTSWKHEVTHWMPLPEPPKEEAK